MNTEEQIAKLLKPRYKVIADYPLSKMYFNVGDILYWNEQFESYRIDEKKVAMNKDTIESFPHLFQPLPWYAERKPEEMPEYFKINPKEEFGSKEIYKASECGKWDWNEVDAYIFRYKKGGGTLSSYLLPATESEYLSYINSKK